jgi:alanyl-tRNA synthetase
MGKIQNAVCGNKSPGIVMPTRRLFWEDPYRREFDAVVLKIDSVRVVLNQTCFYPRGGGQTADLGKIQDTSVVDVEKSDALDIIHILEREASFKVGETVHGTIDWDRRYRIMRLHSAAHIVYYVMPQVFGENCKPASSGLLDDQKDRSDYWFSDKLDREKLGKVEEEANRIILEGRPIETWTDQDGESRYWKMEPFPVMACAGTHVKNSREVGRILVQRGKKPGKGKERIEISLSE